MKVWYFAYGRNMNEDEIGRRLRRPVQGCRAVLPGWTLKFWKLGNDGTGKATIVRPEPGDPPCVEGVAYLLDASDIQTLDRHEGYPRHYDRETVIIYLVDKGKYEVALTYKARPEKIRRGLKPSDSYFRDILQGATQHGLSELWIDYLRRIARSGD